MIDEYTGKKIVSPLDLVGIIPAEILASLSDEDFNSLWGEDHRLKPLSELLPHIAAIPEIRALFSEDGLFRL